MQPAYRNQYPAASATILDEEGYSDDDGLPSENVWIEKARSRPPPLPQSIKYLRVATTGTFSFPLHHNIVQEIQNKGGIYVTVVDANTNLLLAPHRFPRSSKGQSARTLGIPIMDEATFLSLAPLPTGGW